jgi:hypothetical protein
MNNQLFPSINEVSSRSNKIKIIQKNVMDIMRKLGGKVVNSSYLLLEGIVREAYGYYRFPKVGAVMTSLSFSEDLRCLFDVKFVGFENERGKFNKIKAHLEEALRKSGLNSVDKR